MYSFAMSAPLLFGQPLARAERRRCHNIEVPRIRRKIVRRAFDLEIDRGLHTGEGSDTGYDHRVVGTDAIELHLLLEPVSTHVGAHLFRHALDGTGDRRGVRLFAKAKDSVSHDDRRLCRIQDADGLTPPPAPTGFHSTRPRLSTPSHSR